MGESRGGRGRSESSRQSILAATRLVLAAKGYDGLTIEGIATEAGVGKQTIYRWWASKGALVAECIADDAPAAPLALTIPDTGDIRADLAAWLSSIVAGSADPHEAALVRGLISASAESVLVSDRMYSQVTSRAEQSMVERFARVDGSSAGRARAATTAVLGTFLYSLLSNRPLDESAISELADVIARGLANDHA